jgi:hypothetical protein
MPAARTIVINRGLAVRFTVTGGTTPVVIHNATATIDKNPNIKEGHNSTDGILRGRGLRDASGTVRGTVYAEEFPTTQLDDGDTGLLEIDVDEAGHFFSLTAIISGLTIDLGGVGDPETWTFNYQLQSGTLTNPVFTP